MFMTAVLPFSAKMIILVFHIGLASRPLIATFRGDANISSMKNFELFLRTSKALKKSLIQFHF